MFGPMKLNTLCFVWLLGMLFCIPGFLLAQDESEMSVLKTENAAPASGSTVSSEAKESEGGRDSDKQTLKKADEEVGE